MRKDKKPGLLKGAMIMMSCCIVPIIVMTLFTVGTSAIGVGVGGSRLIAVISSLICPIMMIGGMIFMTGKGQDGCCKQSEKDEVQE